MRVISLVPSWTETLIEAGVKVVGRTRYCIHPKDGVRNIPVVGGTKQIDWEMARALNADLILLDQEENPKNIFDASPIPTLVTHAESLGDMAPTLRKMAERLNNSNLLEYAARWESITKKTWTEKSLDKIPGILDWIRKPDTNCNQIAYFIWRDPWMAASPNTFIGSMLSHFGYKNYLVNFTEKYPKLELTSLDPARTLILFSSEPFPFARKREEILALGYPAAIIDGEAYSWFGIRSLKFLEEN